MLNNKAPLILLFCFLGLAFGLNSTLLKNYFFVTRDNRLSYELFQTRNGIVAHAIDRENPTDNFTSNYILIDLPSKDAKPILADVVNACEGTTPATFQHLHYHAQTNSLVYYCVKNSSLLIIDQSNYLVESEIPFNSNSSLPVARLSTDGMSVVVLTMDTLFTQSPQSSILYKVDLQAKKLSTQLLLNSNLTTGEAVVAYAASKNRNYIATNRIENKTFYTVVYSISVIGNTYQLSHLTTFSSPTMSKTLTKLFCLGNFVVVSDINDVYFLNSKGDYVKKVTANVRPLTSDIVPLIYHIGVTSQYDNANLYIHSIGITIDKYSVIAGTLQVKQVEGTYSNLQIAYGNATSGDLAFTTSRQNFTVFDIKTSKTVYTALTGYSDLMMTNTTYVVVQARDSPYKDVYIFDLETDALIAKVSIASHGYYYNKEQQMITCITVDSTICRVLHIDLVSGKTWTTLSFFFPDPVCNTFVDYARMTENGNPELLLPFYEYDQIISETYGTLKFKTREAEIAYDYDRLNVNFDDLSVYYYAAAPRQALVQASFYTLDSQSKEFQIQDSNTTESAPVNRTYFFAINSTIMVILSDKTFRLFDQLGSPVFHKFENNFNQATSFHDADDNHYVLLAFTNLDAHKGTHPELFTISGANTPLPGKRAYTVSAGTAGPKSYFLHDRLSQAVGLVRFYDASSRASASKTLISI